jgi:hypothetical protein
MAAWRNPAMHRDEIFAGAASTNWMGHGVAVKTSGVMPREGGASSTSMSVITGSSAFADDDGCNR